MADQEIFEAKISTTSFPPRLPGNKLALRYKVKSSDLNQSTAWSPIYYINGPTITAATTNTLTAATATKFEVDWSDTNICNYDLFVSYSIDIESYNARVNSVGTTKTIYFLASEASSANIPAELANFRVGDTIDVFNLNLALNGSNMPITELNLTTTPYYIRYTGDSSNSLANTAETVGYIATAESASDEQNSRQYRYLARYPWTADENKSYKFKSATNENGNAVYQRATVIIQVEGINKTIDSSNLTIVKTTRTAL